MSEEVFPQATGVSDAFHAIGHVADAVKAVRGNDAPETAERTATGRVALLGEGKSGIERWIAAGCAVALASDIPPPRPLDVAALVRQLGSDDFAEREAAERRLSTLKVDEVPPELLAALKSPNLEVRERAARAVKTLRGRIALTPLPRGSGT